MIMRFLTLTFVLFCGIAQAETVKVSAGEHPGFTRLIVKFVQLPNWRTEKSGRSHYIAFTSEEALSFDLSRVFRLIGRERVSDVRVAKEGLEIDVACDCDIKVSASGNDALIADIRPRDDLTPAVMDAVNAMPQPSITGSPALPPDAKRENSLRPARNNLHEPIFEKPFRNGFQVPIESPPLYLGDLDLLLGRSGRSAAVDLVGREFSRAAAQGLVAADPEIENRAPISPSRPGLEDLNERANLSVTTGLDVAINPNRDNLPPTDNGAICIPDSRIDVVSWGDATDHSSLGRLRTKVVAEDGSLQAEGALSLARYYISIGFGSEAAIIAAHVESEEERALLTALADVIDKGFSDSSVLNSQVYCKGAVALWAALSRPIETSNNPISTDHILSTFSALPPHLRAHLGPLLSERLRQAGLATEARTAVNAVTRGGEKTVESELATARLDLTGTEAETARQTLSQLSRGTDVTAAEALLELLRDAEARGMAPNPAWVEDAPSLVRAIEGTEVARNLNLAGLRGRIALGWFDRFREGIMEDTPGLTPESRKDLSMHGLSESLKNSSDVDFVKTEIGLSRLVRPEDLPRDVRFEMASRLLDIGLSAKALHYIPEIPETASELEVTAQVFSANGEASRAIALLSAREETDARALLGAILASDGQDVSAIAAYESAGRDDDALAAAIRTGDWNWIVSNDIEELSEAARMLSSPLELSDEEDAANGALIDASRLLREQAKSLLEKTKPTISGETFTN